MLDRDLQHPTITAIERTGYPMSPFANDKEAQHKCSSCEAEISDEQSKYGLCEKCETKASARFKAFLLNEFTENEREYIDACTEGISLTEPEKIKDIKAVY